LLSLQYIADEFNIRETGLADADSLLNWEYEVTRELVKNCFTRAVLTSLDARNQQTLIFIWGERNYEGQTREFYKKLNTASGNITGIAPCLLMTGVLSGMDGLREGRRRVYAMREYFYLTGNRFINYDEMPDLHYSALGLNGIGASLKWELSVRNAAGCAEMFERAITQIKTEPHEKAQASWLCTEMFFTVCEWLETVKDKAEYDGVFSDPSAGRKQIKCLSTREAVIRFLTAVGNELQTMLRPGISHYAEITEQVKKYIRENIEKRVTLQEAAVNVCLSAGYLSMIFKKHCGENFVDYVNRCKIEKARMMLKSDEYLIGQVGEALSFENAYYFAKVFKRYTGMTPSEYRARLKENIISAPTEPGGASGLTEEKE
jgi:two-component system response regulator YesN